MKHFPTEKKIPFILLLTMLAPAPLVGQGTINFNNRVLADGIDARVTWLPDCQPVSGPGWIAQLWGGPAGADVSALSLIGETTFRTGDFAGYVYPIALTVPGVHGGQTATLQMRVFHEGVGAIISGMPLQLVLGGTGHPPVPPANLVGLTWHCIPEPSSFALGLSVMGGLMGWIGARKRRMH
jgi:hypothetical protein